MTTAKSCLESAQVTYPDALPSDCGTYCDFNLNIGMFFDGTDNNMKRDIPTRSHSNIARLSEAYINNSTQGFFRHYIPGVGTPFEELGTDGEDILEAAAGKGGEARIIWGLLQILNSVHAFVNNGREMFNLKQMQALCSNHFFKEENPSQWPRPAWYEINETLWDLQLRCGLGGNEGVRADFLKEHALRLGCQLSIKQTLPRIAGIYLDVFGFSRGAAQARVFTNWLHRYLFIDDKLFGIPSYVRMLGLMDTVASVGSTNATGGEGHWAWATPENLRIHPEVKNCVHYVALHELRTVFPCDSICQDNRLPPNCHEHYYPGAHSDVGGGYAPGCQGKGWRLEEQNAQQLPVVDDSRKLSQLPLNDMYQAAKKTCPFPACSPWLEVKPTPENDTNPLIQQFALDPQVRAQVETYLTTCNIPADLPVDEQLREHGLLYLSWRYRITRDKKFEDLLSVQYAKLLDEDSLHDYRRGQAVFDEQIIEIAKYLWGLYDVKSAIIGKQKNMKFSRDAKQIYKHIKENTDIAPEVGLFFDSLVHDSYAGFIKKLGTENLRQLTEGEGYLRYRGIYLGDNMALNAA